MKVFVASHAHETSSFSPIPTSRQSFEPGYFHPTRETPVEVALERGKGSAYNEWVRLAHEKGYDIALGPAGGAGPSGRTVKADYEAMRDEILERLRESIPVDMALFFLHGSQMAVGYDDCEGDLLARARAMVGPDVPIGVELDLHCNITQAMLTNATIVLACKEYPHTDFADRARDLFALIEDAARGVTKPVMSFCRVPMLNLFFTTVEPMRSLVDQTAALEGRDGVLSVTLCHGFSSADMSDTSASVIVVTDGARERGDAL
ncbi:MAG: M81 family metallopeptidase, partial [Pseudolabrys sp.]|nr:M81 family metallopeptidase [Pseudolabrys sp.]